MLSELLPLISAGLFAGSTLAFGQIIEVQEDSDRAAELIQQKRIGRSAIEWRPRVERVVPEIIESLPVESVGAGG